MSPAFLAAAKAATLRRAQPFHLLESPVFLFVAAFVIYVARRPQVLLRPEFRGEDGQVFYIGTFFTPPLPSLFRPYYGYLYVLIRAVALLERLVPIALAPLVANLTAVLLVAAIATYIGTRLKADPATRLVLAALVLVLPGVTETHGSMTWINWYLALFLAAVPFARRPTNRGGRWPEAGCVLLAGLTTPLVIVLIPLYVQKRDRLLVAASTAAVAQLVTSLVVPRPMLDIGIVGVMLTLFVRGVAEPFLGLRIVSNIGPAAALVLGVLLAALVVRTVRRAPRSWLLAAGYIWTAALLSTAFKSSYPLAYFGNGTAANRYFLLPGLALAGLVVAATVRRPTPTALALCTLLAVGVVSDFVITPLPYLDWPARSACIGGPAPCAVPVNPVDVFTIDWPGRDGVYRPSARSSTASRASLAGVTK